MSDASAFVVEDDGPVRHLVLNRPDKLNALDLDQHVRIKAAVEASTETESVRVLALSGNGRAFCAGDDLTAGAPEGEDPLVGRRVDLDLGTGPAFLLETAATLRACPKPTVVLLHGHALGSGYDYSLSCDFRVATADVNYGDPRIHRALWAAEGWSYKLPRLTNQASVTPIAYLGETMDGRTAHGFGLVHRVYPAGADLRVEARAFLEELAALDPTAYADTKARILASVDLGFEQAMAFTP
ncbi:MAG: enoyl-CoA hydratase/isomerase family protein [Gammaproteobacteria bacterium]|nr:enoyl-CoA hydratase/isomerase family protein [Gammaproteobacteria bacterium]